MKKIIVLVIILISGIQPAISQQDIYSNSAGAIRGYDPVAYFTKGKAVEGKEEIKFEWKGATWHFTSGENKNLFMKDPEKYAPQYGGYCAYAVAHGGKAKIDPEAWSIVDGKLYLNYSPKIQNKWEENKEEYIKSANRNWEDIK